MSSFVPKPYTKEVVTFRIASEKLEQLDQLSQKYGMSRSEFINRCIDYSLDNMKTSDSEK